MVACSVLIESSSKLLVTRTGIKAWSSSSLGQIRRLILELLALQWRKFYTFELKYLWSQLANLDQILCVASLGVGKGCIRFWGRLTLAHWAQVSDRYPLGYLLFMILYMYIAPGHRQTSPRWQSFDFNKNILSLHSFVASLKRNVFEVWFYTLFFMI